MKVLPDFASCLSMLLLVVCLHGCTSAGGSIGLRNSDPQLKGQRDLQYDHLIIPGERIGPVHVGDTVTSVVAHLGNPDTVRHQATAPGYPDFVHYGYKDECIRFTWQDIGVEPKVDGHDVSVSCGKWQTKNGLHVGSSVKEVVSEPGEYCAKNEDDGSLLIARKEGIWFYAADRNSPVMRIAILPAREKWNGLCKDE